MTPRRVNSYSHKRQVEWYLSLSILTTTGRAKAKLRGAEPPSNTSGCTRVPWTDGSICLIQDLLQKLANRQILADGEAQIVLPKAGPFESGGWVTFRQAGSGSGSGEWSLVDGPQRGMVQVPQDSVLAGVNDVRVLRRSYRDTVQVLKAAPSLRPLRMHFRCPPAFSVMYHKHSINYSCDHLTVIMDRIETATKTLQTSDLIPMFIRHANARCWI